MTSRRAAVFAVLSWLICLCAAVPLLYIIYHTFNADPELLLRLSRGQLPRLAARTFALAASVGLTTGLLGLASAWLVERGDIPGVRLWRVLLSLPPAIPGYVTAVCYMFLLRRGGFVDRTAASLLGLERNALPLPDIFSLGGVTFVMSMYTFSFIFIAVSGALRAQDGALEDAARVAGRNRLSVFFRISLPLGLPALAGGLLLVSLYVFSDFGTVSLMRYQTFATAIYREFAGEIGRSAASITSLGLILLILPLLIIQGISGRRRQTRNAGWRPLRRVGLGRARTPALIGLFALVSFSLLIPLAVLIGLTARSVFAPTSVDKIWGISTASLWTSGWNTLLLALLGAAAAVLLALFPAVLSVRGGGRCSRVPVHLAKSAFALPGIIVGLGFLMLLIRTPLYATTGALVLAMAFRLLPQAVTLNEASIRLVPHSLEEASCTLGRGPWSTLFRITVPIAAPGLLASWSLAFVTAMKELPLLVILRPPGFDTLPVRIWEAANDAVYTQSAPPALLLIGLTALGLGCVNRLTGSADAAAVTGRRREVITPKKTVRRRHRR